MPADVLPAAGVLALVLFLCVYFTRYTISRGRVRVRSRQSVSLPRVSTPRHGVRVNANINYSGNIPPREELAHLFDDECEAMLFLMRYNILNTLACPVCGAEKPKPKWKSAWPDGVKKLPH